jgi:methylaspartate mutase sigma subunit
MESVLTQWHGANAPANWRHRGNTRSSARDRGRYPYELPVRRNTHADLKGTTDSSDGRNGVARGNTVVTGVIGEDPHIVGNKLLVRALREAGYQVVSLGIRVSQEEFLGAAIETNAGAILISSLSGHGEILCRGLREKCIEAGIGDILLYVGGNVVVGNTDWSYVERTFRAMGVDRVFRPGMSLEGALRDLADDLADRGCTNGRDERAAR